MFLYDSRSLRIFEANDAALARYGYSRRELRTMTIRDLRPAGDTSALESSLHVDRDTPSHSLWTHVTSTGVPFPVEVRLAPFIRGRRHLSLMSVIDASAWSETRLKLVRSEELHRSLVEECPFGIYRFNLTTSCLEQANPALLRIVGYSFEEFSSVSIADLGIAPADRDRFLAELLTTGNARDYETLLRKKTGEIIRVSISGYLCSNAETGHRHIQGYILDITRQRELEERLSHSHRMEAVGRLAGGVAHDFNNITQSISLSCELALRYQLAPAIESKLLDIMQQTERAAEITRQLLAFSRRQVLQPSVVNLNECVRRALSMLTRAVGVDVSIDLNLDETIDHVFVDPQQLTLVLMHLADNARNAMPRGGRLQISTATCSIGSALNPFNPAATCTLLTVADTGVGMNEATLQRIFEPFFSTKNTSLATGLGLSTVHGIISQSKGHIECESTLGQGTTFRIFLPIAAAQPAVSSVLSTEVNEVFRILLAEDDPIVNKHLTNALNLAGFSVDSVSNGEEALTAFANGHYHVIVTDIVMPKLGGIELTKRLRQLAPQLPVVLISGYSEEVSVMQHLPSTHIAYLQKPFASSQLVATLRRLLAT
jgi:PAS domain S-box-containing protein